MQSFARENVPAITAVLSVVSLALIFAAALEAVPAGLLPRAPEAVLDAIPHVNAVLIGVALVVVALGWYWIRRGRVRRHRLAMVTGFALFVAFLALYLYRVALEGPTAYGGTGTLATVYYAVLAVHVLLAVACVPLLYYVLLLGITRPIPAVRASMHPRVGRVAASLWLVSFALGLVVYAMLYVF